jgi:hypothetical protein
MKTYIATRINHEPVVLVDEDGRASRLDPGRSLRINNHSPDGFEWGYGGSGPAQFALAILLDLTDDGDLAESLHQEFKRRFVATAPKEGFRLAEEAIRAWISATEQNR